jgi:sec-independent protein translocase protein TatA
LLNGILQPTHLLLIGLALLLVLGPKRLPGAGRALGQGLKEFKSSMSSHDGDEHLDDRPALEAEQRS